MMPKGFRQDLIYLLQGMTVTFAIAGAIGTIGGLVLFLLSVVVPRGMEQSFQEAFGTHLEGDIMIAALIDTLLWLILLEVGFISRSLGRRMAQITGVITLFLFAIVLVSIL